MRAIAVRLAALVAVLLLGLGLAQPSAAQAIDEVPVVVAGAPVPSVLPAGSHGCFDGSCEAVVADGVTFYVFSPADNGYDAIVAAYDGQGRLQSSERTYADSRYFTSISVDAANRVLVLPGQGGRPGTVSFDVLDRLALQARIVVDAPARVAIGAAVDVRVDVTAEGYATDGSVELFSGTPGAIGTASLGTAPVASGAASFALAAGTLPAGETELVAVYAPTPTSPLAQRTSAPRTIAAVEQHEVTFVGFDGALVAVVPVLDGDAVQTPAAPERVGYGFTGWSGVVESVTEDFTSTAQYQPYRVGVVLLVDLEPLEFLERTFDAPYGELPTPSAPDGYRFAGWYTAPVEGEGTLVVADTLVTTPESHVLVARFDLDRTVASIVLTASAPEVTQGGSLGFVAQGFNDAGLAIGDVTADVVLSSDVATDRVQGATVTFPSASPHTITATHVDGATAQVVVEVRAAVVAPAPSAPAAAAPAATLPVTGGEPMGLLALAALVLVGLGLVARRRLA